jgi:hypothetical protein
MAGAGSVGEHGEADEEQGEREGSAEGRERAADTGVRSGRRRTDAQRERRGHGDRECGGDREDRVRSEPPVAGDRPGEGVFEMSDASSARAAPICRQAWKAGSRPGREADSSSAAPTVR